MSSTTEIHDVIVAGLGAMGSAVTEVIRGSLRSVEEHGIPHERLPPDRPKRERLGR